MQEKIIIGADALGYRLKDYLKAHLLERGFAVEDIGTHDPDNPLDYYDVGRRIGEAVSAGRVPRGVACCATGMGPGIVANKFRGVYAGVVESDYTAERCKVVNNCNVLTMGERVLTPERAATALDRWLDAQFGEGCGFSALSGYLAGCLEEIRKIEEKNMKEGGEKR